jgi:hypothetical protein
VTALKLCLLIGVHLVGFILPGAAVEALWQQWLAGARRPFIATHGSQSNGDGDDLGVTTSRRATSHRAISSDVTSSNVSSRQPLNSLLRTLVFSGVIAYGSFFAYVLSPLLGRLYSLGVLGASVALLVFHRGVREFVRTVFAHRDVLTPLLIAVSVGVLFTGSTLLYGGEVHVSLVANSRYRDPLPPDNILPRLVAERVVDGIRGEPFLGDWLSSDRAPLQSAVETLMSPLIPKGSRELNYQAIATMLQLLVIPAGWILLRRLRLSAEVALGVIVATALSGTMALHSTYVWPKLLCAAYSLLCIAALLPGDVRRATTNAASALNPALQTEHNPEQNAEQKPDQNAVSMGGQNPDRLLGRGLLSGAALGLSFAAHGGALFVLLPMMCVLTVLLGRSLWFARRRGTSPQRDPSKNVAQNLAGHRPAIRTRPREFAQTLGGALLVCALLLAPWLAYQRVIAPPGNRLLKWHLAGVVDVDQRSFRQAMVDQYTQPSLREILANKTSNIRELVNPQRFLADVVPLLGSDDSIDRVRQREFGSLGNAVSISMVGVTMGLVGWLVRRRRSRELVVGLLGIAAGSLATVLWCLALYGPKATLPHQGSLAVPVVLIGSSALLAASAHRWALGAFVALSGYKVTRVWILAGPLSPERQRSTAALTMLLIGAFALIGVVATALQQPTFAQRREPNGLVAMENESVLANEPVLA